MSTILENNLLIIKPTVEVVSEALESVGWQVLYPDLTPVANPELILTELEVQIDRASGRIYDSGWVPVSDRSHAIASPITWASVDTVFMTSGRRQLWPGIARSVGTTSCGSSFPAEQDGR